jgi:hypothetical protein
MPPNTVKVDRTTRWGNPFVIGVDGDQARCVDLCRRLLEGENLAPGTLTSAHKAYREMVLKQVHALHGLNLACWCKPGTPCHADVLLTLAAQAG